MSRTRAPKIKHEIDPANQVQIFGVEAGEITDAPDLPPPQIISPEPIAKTAPIVPPMPEIPTTYGKVGSYAKLDERAGLLISALKGISASNLRGGFDVASNNGPYSPPIWGKYQRHTPMVQRGAARRMREFDKQTRYSFWQATGYTALRKARLQNREQTDSNGRKMWRDFTAEYSHTGPVAVARNKYIAKLEKTKQRVKAQKSQAKDKAA